MSKKPKMGRPTRSKSAASQRIVIRVTEEEAIAIARAAQISELSVAEFVRTKSLAAAKRLR